LEKALSVIAEEALDDWFALLRNGWATAEEIFGTIAQLGPEESAWARFVAREPAAAAYRKAFRACEAGRAGALDSLRAEGDKIRTIVAKSGLGLGNTTEILETLEDHEAAFLWPIEELEAAIAADKRMIITNGRRSLRQLTSRGAAKTQRIFKNRIDSLKEEAAILQQSDRLLLQAFSKWNSHTGGGMQSQLRPALEFLASLKPDARAKVREAVRAAQDLRAALDRAADLSTQNRLVGEIEKTLAPINQTARNGLAGYLGEALVRRWEVWQREKQRAYRGAVKLAQDLQQEVGGEWTALSPAGEILLDGRKTWDEAIIVARKPEKGVGIREARLSMGAQIKVVRDWRPIDQIVNDQARERVAASIPGQILQVGDEQFILRPMLRPSDTERWILNAGGANYPAGQLALLEQRGIQVNQMQLPLSRDEVRALGDGLLFAFVDADLPAPR
jgi:hypothetical protein